jgi:hypothetical protein
MLAFTRPVDPTEPQSPVRIHTLDLGTGAVQALDYRLDGGISVQPRFSPDGRAIAFRHGSPPRFDVYRYDRASRRLERVTQRDRPMRGFDWSRDGDGFIAALGDPGAARLALIARDGAMAELPLLRDAQFPTLARRGERLVYASIPPTEINIVLQDVIAADATLPPRRAVFPATRWSVAPHFNPDGSRIAFASARRGGEQVWIGDPLRGDPVVVSRFERGTSIVTLDWVDAEQLLVTVIDAAGPSRVLALDTRSGAERLLLMTERRVRAVAQAADGSQLLVIPEHADEPPMLIARDGEERALPERNLERAELPGDGHVYFSRRDDRSVYRAAVSGAWQPQRLACIERATPYAGWLLHRDRIVFLARTRDGHILASAAADGSGEAEFYSALAGPFANADFDLAPDGTRIALAADFAREADLMLVDGNAPPRLIAARP